MLKKIVYYYIFILLKTTEFDVIKIKEKLYHCFPENVKLFSKTERAYEKLKYCSKSYYRNCINNYLPNNIIYLLMFTCMYGSNNICENLFFIFETFGFSMCFINKI